LKSTDHIQFITKLNNHHFLATSAMTVMYNIHKHAFAVAGARLWNSLLHDIVASDTLSHFRRGLKTFLFRQSYLSILF